MTTIHSYKDSKTQLWANIRLDNNDPVFISVAQTGVLIKNSKIGIFGKKLFQSGKKDPTHFVETLSNLENKFPKSLIPPDVMINDYVLKIFVNACLHCSTLNELEEVLNEVEPQVGKDR